MDLRVVHPVPLTVTDVVPDLHVLNGFRVRQQDRADHPARPRRAAGDHQPGRQIQYPLKRDHPVQVGGVRATQGSFDVRPDRVQLGADRLDVRRTQVRVLRDIADCHLNSRSVLVRRQSPGHLKCNTSTLGLGTDPRHAATR